jgi:hypothetical protein
VRRRHRELMGMHQDRHQRNAPGEAGFILNDDFFLQRHVARAAYFEDPHPLRNVFEDKIAFFVAHRLERGALHGERGIGQPVARISVVHRPLQRALGRQEEREQEEEDERRFPDHNLYNDGNRIFIESEGKFMEKELLIVVKNTSHITAFLQFQQH